MKKRFLSTFLVLVLVLVLTPFFATQANAESWVPVTYNGQVVDSMTYRGVTVNAVFAPRGNISDYDSDSTYCCAALVHRFYSQVFGVTVSNLWSTTSVPAVNSGSFSVTSTPKVGDIIRTNTHVHWAIVKEVNGNNITVFQQNAWSSDYTKAWVGRVISATDSTYTFFRYSGNGPDSAYLDLNGSYGGTNYGNIADWGTADVYINGSLVADDCTDYYTQWPVGTSYQITDIRAKSGYQYDGVASGSLSGTIGSGGATVVLKFSREPATIAFMNYSGFVPWQTASAQIGSNYTLPTTYPKSSSYYFIGWTYTKGSKKADVLPGETIKISNNVLLYPAYYTFSEMTSGNEVQPYNINDFNADGYVVTKVPHTTSRQVDKSYWTGWSGYSLNAVSASSTVQVRTAPMYRYYCFYCPYCGGREPYSGKSDCGADLPSGSWQETWSTISYANSNSVAWPNASAKRYTTSLGDGLLWNFNTANLYDTAIGTTSSDGATVIAQGYSYRTYVEKYETETITTYGYIIKPEFAITSQPKDASGKVGDKVSFSIAAAGNNLTYKWEYSTDNGKTWKASSSTSDTATCTLAASRDGWLYRCTVTNEKGTSLTSNTAKVTVLPAITAQPKDASGKVGDKLTFTVGATGVGLTYKWEYSTDGGKTWKASSSTSATATCTLSSGRDGWLYRCTITDSHGKTVVSNTAKVSISASITAQPKNASGKVGDVLKFTVAASGEGLTYQWQYSTNGGKTWQASSSKSTTATCTLVNASRDGWLYRCIVKDSKGNTLTSKVAAVIVKPAITVQPKNAAGAVGQKVQFSIAATGVELTYQWQYSTDGGKTWKASSSKSTTATCTLSDASRNGWLYRCIITDGHGTKLTSATAKVIVKTALKITSQPKYFIGKIGDVAKFTVKATGDGLKYKWQYSTDNGATWKTSSSTSNTATCTLVSMERDGWVYRCIITDQYGESVTSSNARVIID